MDGNKNILRRAALPTLALSLFALPLAGAVAQDAPGQQPLVAQIAAPSHLEPLTDEIVPVVSEDAAFESSFARFDIDPPAPDVSGRTVDLESFDPPVEVEPEVWRSGVASYYGAKFNGRRTASGERFDMNALTAAHKTLPFGTKVRVTNPNTGKSVVVRINDRGPYAHGREIDLSRRAATELGLIQRGHGTVELALVN
ncbi:septal ring lytic transglycosylase RlpA family protein [Alteriqipengyuania lutimaris]|uniref:Endolytic peptidoglycan transglycosylase RlpA n=1 Tax=Alteriqipengyuania lutimaris TaxID=1538146 RepID=A0A395LGF6_9SPHN|nr:septal ring lytic transglycosylase RlpA family protein [Alteriqipengyuania lutimaris]MBB3035258.1 rare lipoprotein A [Alteriqipengyuania lutimaris]RDS75853.1 septal ring lytic transglycosylase RlpA family protein [Alteriqipengyuania lutimaris]